MSLFQDGVLVSLRRRKAHDNPDSFRVHNENPTAEYVRYFQNRGRPSRITVGTQQSDPAVLEEPGETLLSRHQEP